jgi:predicted phosphodiesterase
VRLWLMSDIHLESTRGWDLPGRDTRPAFDVMVIAGDLIPKAERGVAWILQRVPDRPVIYLLGNHESYGTDIDRTLQKAKDAAAGTNVHVMENETIHIGGEDGVTFAVATLWTDYALNGDAERSMAVAGDRMNDSKKIRTSNYRQRFLPHHALARHNRSVAFLEAEMRKPRKGKQLVVATHHAPLPDLTNAPGGSGNDSALDPAFRSDLRRLMVSAPDDGRGVLRPADLWIYGHTHESFDSKTWIGSKEEVGETRVVSNAKGYGPWPGQHRSYDNAGFDEKLIIEI